ncbi:MAG TPA: ATP-binding protein [Bacteroidales bacterium]|nr:ATP-binding protein [Bacteroidales bacterium]
MSYNKYPDIIKVDNKINEVVELERSGVDFFQAIENADGVPFQLIFGPVIGEGFYLNMGSGINQLLGIKPEDFTEKVFNNMIEEIIPLSDDLPVNIIESRCKFINGDIKSYRAEILLRLPDGRRKWIEDSSLPLKDPETGKIVGSYGILFDIDRRKQSIIFLEKARQKAEEGDRLKSAFLNNISHEIRTPLNAIVGFSSLLTEAADNSDDSHRLADIILRSSDHLLEILNDIVEIANIEAGNIRINNERFNINERLNSIYNRFYTSAGERDLILDMAPGLDDDNAFILTDPYKVCQVLCYLISNAVKFTRKGRIEFGYLKRKGELEFYVADTGIGIEKEFQDHIYERFFQVESDSTRRYEGTGLGLSISRAYVEALGGRIWLSSQPGKGSVFYFTIPLD